MSCGVDHRHGLDLALLCRRLMAVGPIGTSLGTSIHRGCSPKKAKKKEWKRSSCHGVVETNLTRNHEVASSISGLALWVKDLSLL